MGHEFPGEHTPLGKPRINVRQSATSCGTLPIHTGHGKELGPTQAPRSFPGKASTSNGATSKGGLTIHTGHGKEYGQVSSRG